MAAFVSAQGVVESVMTIVEPVRHIADVWGKQCVGKDDTFRMMRYVLRVEHDGRTLLHNTVTGQLSVLDQDEADALDSLPSAYSPWMEPLIAGHYLVPEDCDEHRQVIGLRRVLRLLMPQETCENAAITNYTILPTTACNARCYYCYECDVRKVTMTEQTADDTVRFIAAHCGPEKQVRIRWFGGEPTVGVHRIDQICEGLRENGIGITSTMTTNGYLFDEAMVSKARSLWNLQEVMISVDGTEEHYNEIKDYVGAQDNPYQRVLRNVGLLLDAGVRVNLRMNFDVGNYRDFADLLEEAKKRYHGNRFLRVYAFPVKGKYPDKTGEVHHGDLKTWGVDELVKLNDMACAAGLYRRRATLPSLHYTGCSASDPSCMVISPEGNLTRCVSIFDRENQIVGTVKAGITTAESCSLGRHLADPPECTGCALFPDCVLIVGCPGGTDCFMKEIRIKYVAVMKSAYEQLKTGLKEESQDVHGGTESGICAD